MKLILAPVALLILLFFLSIPFVSAQSNYSNVNVDELTDTQVREIMQRAAFLGYDDAQTEQLAASQGMRPNEVIKLRIRIDQIRRRDKSSEKRPTVAPANTRTYVLSDSVIANNSDASYQQSVSNNTPGNGVPTIFGEDIFRNSRMSFEPNLRMATPKGYVIGPDDELLVDITGDNEASYNLKVSPEGTIKLQYVGILALGGLTIEQATSKIKANMIKTYPGLKSGRTSLAVNLGNIRSIKVTLVGEVAKPGSYTLSSLSTPFNALYASGGPGRNGSFRKIQLIRNNRVVSTIDIYNFLLKGIQSNIRLQDQDVINVPVYNKRVEISGEVKRPALFEVSDTESLQDLINFAGGFTSQAYSANIKIIQNTNRERKIVDVNADEFVNYRPQNGDKYVVETILNRFENRVEIQGAVFRPGKFELEKGLTLKSLISKADGLREDAFLNRGYLLRLNTNNTQSLLVFDVQKIVNGTEPDIRLQREDQITISSLFDLRDEYKVEVQGEVRTPGVLAYVDNMTLESVIQMSGGFKEGASPNRIEVSRRVKNSDALSALAITSNIFTINIDPDLKIADRSFILQPFDIVTVRSSEGYEVQKIVRIEGEVLYPGSYTIQRKDEKISDLINRAGGLTAMAFAEGASLKRPGRRPVNPDSPQTSIPNKNTIKKADEENERLLSLKRLQGSAGPTDIASLKQDPSMLRSEQVGIDLVEILQKPKSRYNLLLEDGDTVRIPKQLQTVRVSGEVLKPTNIVYKSGKRLGKYIRESGGFTDRARKRDVYVEYANGSIKATKTFLFFYTYPKVTPGAEVFVPKKAERQGMGVQAIVGITSALTSLAVIIVALFK